MTRKKLAIFPYINSGTRNHVIDLLQFARNRCEAASSLWIVEAATAPGSSVKEIDRGEGEDGPL